MKTTNVTWNDVLRLPRSEKNELEIYVEELNLIPEMEKLLNSPYVSPFQKEDMLFGWERMTEDILGWPNSLLKVDVNNMKRAFQELYDVVDQRLKRVAIVEELAETLKPCIDEVIKNNPQLPSLKDHPQIAKALIEKVVEKIIRPKINNFAMCLTPYTWNTLVSTWIAYAESVRP